MVLLEGPVYSRMAAGSGATCKPSPCWDARLLTESVLRSPAFSSGLITRKHLILTLLEDASFRLSALHAEVMLRWRIASANPGPQTQALLSDLGNNLQPKLLRAALYEDISSSTRMLLTPEPLQHLLCPQLKNDASQDAAAVQPVKLGSWASYVVQLDVHQLSVLVGVLPVASRSPDPNKLPMEALNLADLKDPNNPLPAFLFEYESPTAAQADNQAHKAASSTSSAMSPPMSATSLPEQTFMPPLMSGEVKELASVGSVPTLRRCSGLSGSNNLSAGSFFSPTISSRSSRQGTQGDVPQEVANCWEEGSAAPNVMTNAAAAVAGGSGDGGKPAAGLSAALMMQHQAVARQSAEAAAAAGGAPRRMSKPEGGAAGSSSGAGGLTSASPVISHRSSHDAPGAVDVVGSSYGSSQGMPQPGLVQYVTEGNWAVGSLGAQQVNWGAMGSSLPSSSALHGGLFSPSGAPDRNQHDAGYQHLSPSSIMSEENEEQGSQSVHTELETALEAMMSHDGTAEAYPGAHQQALQQHGAAIMRAARAGGFMPGAGAAAAGGSAVQGGSYEAAAKALGMNFAAATRPEHLPGAGNMSLLGGAPPTVGSAPTTASMAAYMKHAATTHKVASYNHLSPEPTNLAAISADSLGSGPSHMDMLLTNMHGTQGLGYMANHLAVWPGVHGNDASHVSLDAATATSMLGRSAPTALRGGPAMMAAAARSMALQQQQQQGQQHFLAATNAALVAAAAAKDQAQPSLLLQCISPGNNRLVNKLSPKTRAEVQQAVTQLAPGIKIEDLDDGVLFQLVRGRSEEEALAALRSMAAVEQLGNLQQLAAYMAHASPDAGGLGLSAQAMAPLRAAPTSMASKGLLQKLPPRVLQRLEEVVSRCSYMDWKHFDAGVIKVMGQLSELSEADVLEELQLLEATDLSNVEYMPAYLNKRLNNRLWSRRKAQQQQQAC